MLDDSTVMVRNELNHKLGHYHGYSFVMLHIVLFLVLTFRFLHKFDMQPRSINYMHIFNRTFWPRLCRTLSAVFILGHRYSPRLVTYVS